MTLQHYATVLYPGIFVADTSDIQVASRDIKDFIFPQHATGVRFYSREEVEVNGELLKGKPKNQSGWFYIGEVITLEQVTANPNDFGHALLTNMKCNGWSKMVKVPSGSVYRLNDEDVVLKKGWDNRG